MTIEKISIVLFIAGLGLSSCDHTTEKVNQAFETIVLPHPKVLESSEGGLVLSEYSKLYSPKTVLQPLLELYGAELQKLTGIDIEITSTNDHEADVVFEIDSSLSTEEYLLEIDNSILVTGGSYQAVAMAKSSLLQLVKKEGTSIGFPLVKIRDYPDASYRGLLIDLARRWHDVESIKKVIDLAAYYKIRYLQVHLTDDQSFTFPTETFRKLPTPGRHYSKQELKELVAYARIRGVTIIPELEIPGHAFQFVTQYPEIFGVENSEENSNVVNMGREEVYQAIDQIIGEIVEIFYNSPYFHIGGDEARLSLLEGDPDVMEFMKKYDLGTDVHELFRYFIVRLNEMVKSHDKIMCVWEGFERRGEVSIPKDIIVFEFETNKYLPNHLIEDGYTVVNTSWKPLYVVNKKKWSPQKIYSWNMWRWENWWKEVPSYNPIQLQETPLVIGAQMCSWEQTQEVELPTLRKRLPAFAERVWNTTEKIEYDVFIKNLNQTDLILSKLIGDNRQDSLLFDYNFAGD